MKYFYLTLSFIIISINANPLLTHAEESNQIEILSTFKEDVTGNGLKETIELKGIRLSTDTNYYQNVWLEVTNHHGKKTEISYQGGYNPSIHLISLNNNTINNILYQSISDLNRNTQTNYLHSLRNGKVNEIKLPRPLIVSGELIEQFKLRLSIPSVTSPTYISLEKHAEKYTKKGFYNKKGQLLSKRSMRLIPIVSLDPLLINADNSHVLRIKQTILEPLYEEKIGSIETLWQLNDSQWTNLQTRFIEEN